MLLYTRELSTLYTSEACWLSIEKEKRLLPQFLGNFTNYFMNLHVLLVN